MWLLLVCFLLFLLYFLFHFDVKLMTGFFFVEKKGNFKVLLGIILIIVSQPDGKLYLNSGLQR